MTILHLPRELLIHVTSFLDWRSLIRLGEVNSVANGIISYDNIGWFMRCVGSLGVEPADIEDKPHDSALWRNKFRTIVKQGHIPMPRNSLVDPISNVIALEDQFTVKRLRPLGYQTEQSIRTKMPWKIPPVVPFIVPLKTKHGNFKLQELSIFYYEVTLKPAQQQQQLQGEQGNVVECVAVGIADTNFPLQGKLPGWVAGSFAYHSDDGNAYRDFSLNFNYGASFGAGDTVGCGIDVVHGILFFTINGHFIDVAFQISLPPPQSPIPLIPTIGIDSKCTLEVNFGQRAFIFDLTSLPVSNKLSKNAVIEFYKTMSARSTVGDPRRNKFGTTNHERTNSLRFLRLVHLLRNNIMNNNNNINDSSDSENENNNNNDSSDYDDNTFFDNTYVSDDSDSEEETRMQQPLQQQRQQQGQQQRQQQQRQRKRKIDEDVDYDEADVRGETEEDEEEGEEESEVPQSPQKRRKITETKKKTNYQ